MDKRIAVPSFGMVVLLLAGAGLLFAATVDVRSETRVMKDRKASLERKTAALRNLGQAGDKAARKALVDFTRTEKSSYLKARAVEALAGRANKDSAGDVVAILNAEKDYEVKYAAVYALGYMGDPAAVPVLSSLVNDGTQAMGLRLQAVNSLANFPTDEVFATLTGLLDSPDTKIRRQALVSLHNGFGYDRARVLPYIRRMVNDKATEKTARQLLDTLGVQ